MFYVQNAHYLKNLFVESCPIQNTEAIDSMRKLIADKQKRAEGHQDEAE